MRRGGAGLIAAVLALAGCKATDPKPADKSKEPGGLPVAKGRTPPWLDGGFPGRDTAVPKADSWADPRSPGFDVASEVRGVLAGRVLDPAGRGAKSVYVRIEPAELPAADKGATVGILTDAGGYFMAKGLKPGVTYNLTAEAQLDGKSIYGVVQAKTPNPTLTIALRDDLGAPPGSPGPAAPAAGLPGPPPVPGAGLPPPAGDLIPPMGLTPLAGTRPEDGGWSPGGAAATRPLPPTLPPAGGTPPAAPPAPADLTPPAGPTPKPENVADGPRDPFKPPAASIPGPAVPSLPTLPTLPKDDRPGGKTSSRVKPGANFTLIDPLERPWDFATAKSGSLVLLDFMTTTCLPCKKTIPILTDLQARYGAAGLQLIGVACDEAPLRQRVELAENYRRDHGLNYVLFVEPGPKAGTVRDRFQVDSYPTAILLDGTGSVVWRGHPGTDRASLENAIRQQLGK